MDAHPTERDRPHGCVPLDDRFYAERRRFRDSLDPGHPLATLSDEHTHILLELSRLECAIGTEHPSSEDLRTADEVSAFLLRVEPHHQREELVLFPALRERGIEGPPEVMEREHTMLRNAKHRLRSAALVGREGEGITPSAWEELRSVAEPLIGALRAHIAKEDAILYPLARREIAPEKWPELRARCDAIGYCCSQSMPE
jgi:DUF438 domain-containing protein